MGGRSTRTHWCGADSRHEQRPGAQPRGGRAVLQRTTRPRPAVVDERRLRVVQRHRQVPRRAGPDRVPGQGRDRPGHPRPRAVAPRRSAVARSTATTSPPRASTTSRPSPTARTCSASTATPRPRVGGRDYSNVYGFLFRFDDDGLIDRVWEHWGTLAAYEQLFQPDLVVADPDVMLMTTPSVRLRLDLERPVPREVIEQCLDVAVHAPNGSNTQPYKFLCIDDDERKLAIAELYRTAMQEFMDRPRTAAPEDNVDRTTERQQRIARSVFHLRDHLHEVPVLCVPDRRRAHRRPRQGRAGRTHVGVLAVEPLGLGDPDAVVVHARRCVRAASGPRGPRSRCSRNGRWRSCSASRSTSGCRSGCSRSRTPHGTEFAVTPREPAAKFLRWNEFSDSRVIQGSA